MAAKDILVHRRNVANDGWEDVLVPNAASSNLGTDSNTNPVMNPLALTATAVTGQNKTLAAASIATGYVVDTVTTGACTDTLDTAAAIIAALPALATPGNSFAFIVQNASASAYTITMAMGAGITAVTTITTIPQSAAARFRLVSTSATTLAFCIG